MPQLLLSTLLVTPAWSGPETTVEVPGYGSVPLEDARATCTNGTGIGALAGPGDGPRRAALVEWGRLQLAEGAHEGWPQNELALTYTEVELPWVPRGVITACWAAGRHDVQTGLAIRHACDRDRTACRDAFAPGEHELVKDALKAKVRHRRDGLFAALTALPDLASWHAPFDALERACTWPQQASAAGRFIDTDDLAAARSACVQLLELMTGNAAAEVSGLVCAGSWAQVPSDVLPTPDTDLGVLDAIKVASSTEVQLATVRDKLTRMNPAATCEASGASPEQQLMAGAFGATWSADLVAAFQEAQSTRACADVELPLGDRLGLCPDLVARAEANCGRSDHVACDLLARLHLEGVGVDQDEAAAFDVWQASCNAAHEPACEALNERGDRIRSWFAASLEAAEASDAANTETSAAPMEDDPLEHAADLVARFGSALGPEWVADASAELFAAAIAAERTKQASDIITLYGPTLGEDWQKGANEELAALKTALEKKPR